MKKVLAWLGGTCASVVIAVLCISTAINSLFGSASVQNGDWNTSLLAGDSNADPYSKAAVAVGGLLATRLQDSMYYSIDSINGEPLKANCTYRIQGKDMDANWWSITAYGPDHFLMPNPVKRYSFNNGNVQREPDGSFIIHVSRQPQPGNWLPIGKVLQPQGLLQSDTKHDFDLLLRIYEPGSAYLDTPERAELPQLSKEGCQ